MKIILFEPEIPQNAGNIVRTCSVTGAGLILVKPLGFSLTEKQIRRAGLDYWDEVEVEVIDDLVSYLKETKAPFSFFSSKGKKRYTEISYGSDHLLIFGSESSGLAPIFHELWPDHFVTLPMKKNARCLNLANSAAIGLYEACRQHDFAF